MNGKCSIITSRCQKTASQPSHNKQITSWGQLHILREVLKRSAKYVERFTHLFHEITFTSALCALKEVNGDFPTRVSQIAMFPSTEQEANTSDSVGLHYIDKSWKKSSYKIELLIGKPFVSYHMSLDSDTKYHIGFNYLFIGRMCTCRSSTLAECPTKGLGSTFHVESDAGSHKWMQLLQSPLKWKGN